MATVVHPAGQVDPPIEQAGPEPVSVRNGRRGGRFTRWLIVTHRWTALTLGLVLVVATTSGALLLYHNDIQRWTNPGAYVATPTDDPIPMTDALDIVAASDPGFEVFSVISVHGIYRVHDPAFATWVNVDPGTGEILGSSDDGGGALSTAFGFLANLHDCWLSCESLPGRADLPGYVPWLAEEVPGLPAITWGGFILGMTGVLLLFLALSGIWLWWPGVKRLVTGLRVRRGRGRYARDVDLHRVLGMIALPFLLMWGLTATGFEFPFVGDAIYAATPGPTPEEEVVVLSEESGGPDITPEQAVEAARSVLPSGAVLVELDLPVPDEPTATYVTWWQDGFDPYAQGEYPGDVGVATDRHTGRSVITFGEPGQAVATALWQAWLPQIHFGYIVSPWWRLIWFGFGMIPLILAVTGLSTWLYRRGVKKARRKARAERTERAELRADPVCPEPAGPEAVPDRAP